MSIATPDDTVGRGSIRVGWVAVGVFLIAAIVLFAMGRSMVPPRQVGSPPNWYSLAAMACVLLLIGAIVGVVIKADSDPAIVFDHNVGMFYYGKYQADPVDVPLHAKPITRIQHVACYKGYKIGQVSIVLSEPEGKSISILEPLVGRTKALAQELAEFLNVPVIEVEEPAEES